MRDRNITIAVVLLLAFAASAVYDDSAGTGQAFLQGKQKCAQAYMEYTLEEISNSKVYVEKTIIERPDWRCIGVDINKYDELIRTKKHTNWETYPTDKDISYDELMIIDAENMFNERTGVPFIDDLIELSGANFPSVTHFVIKQETDDKLVAYMIKDVRESQNVNNFVGSMTSPIMQGSEDITHEFSINPFTIAGYIGDNGNAAFTILRPPTRNRNSITGGAITGMQLAGGNGETVSPGPHGDSEKACEVSTTTAGTKSITCSKTVVAGKGTCKSDAECNAVNHLDCVASACIMVAGVGGDECTSDAECAGPGTGTYAEEVPKEGGPTVADLWKEYKTIGEIDWTSSNDIWENLRCSYNVGLDLDSGFGEFSFGTNLKLYDFEENSPFTWTLGTRLGVQTFGGTDWFDTGEPDNTPGATGNIEEKREKTETQGFVSAGTTLNYNLDEISPRLSALVTADAKRCFTTGFDPTFAAGINYQATKNWNLQVTHDINGNTMATLGFTF